MIPDCSGTYAAFDLGPGGAGKYVLKVIAWDDDWTGLVPDTDGRLIALNTSSRTEDELKYGFKVFCFKGDSVYREYGGE